MKKTYLVVLTALLCAGLTGARITLPETATIELDNGLTVMVVERHTLPLISIQMTFRAGSIHDPKGREGLANFCSEMLMRGTKSRTAKQIAEEIAQEGGSLSVFCTQEKAGFTGEFLSDKAAGGMEVLGDLLTNALFSQDEIDKTRDRLVAGLESRRDDAAAMANDYIFASVLGGNAYAHIPDGTVSGLKQIRRDDVVAYFAGHFTPGNCLLVICGDLDVKTATAWANSYFGRWAGSATVAPVTADFGAARGTDILILDKTDASQTQIRIGNVGLPMSDPQYVPFEAARTIYAGSFTSRLTNEIRVKRGLSYGVACRSNRFAPGGIVYVSTFTKNATVGEVIDIILNESRRFQTEAVPDSELAGAVNYRCGLYPLQFETNESIADAVSNIWFYRLSKSVYEEFQEQMRTVTPGQLKASAGRFFPLDDYRLVLVGKADEIKTQVEKYGKVTIRPLTGE